MKKFSTIVFLLFLYLSVFGQIKTTRISSLDSVITILNYSDTTDLESAFWNDSSQIIVNGIHKTFKSPLFENIRGENDKQVELTTPEFLQIHKLKNSLYAIIGWSAWYKCQLKYIWILKTETTDFIITKKIFFSSPRMTKDRSYEINYSFDPLTSQLIINNNANGIIEKGGFPGGFFPGLKVFDQNNNEVKNIEEERLKNFRLVRFEDRVYTNENEINYFIKI